MLAVKLPAMDGSVVRGQRRVDEGQLDHDKQGKQFDHIHVGIINNRRGVVAHQR